MKKTPKTRLLRAVIRRNGVASAREIARAHITGSALADARAQTAGLVVWEQICRKGRGKRTTVARLTLKGVLETVRIFPDYTPDFRLLIAETDLRAMLAQAAADHTPLALELARDREDAGLYREAEARRKEAARAAEAKRAAREKPAAKYPSAGRNRSEEDLAARREWAASKWPQKDESVEESDTRRENRIPEPSYYRPTPQAEVRPTAQATPADSGLEARIRQAGYTVQNGKVQYGGDRWISISDWMAKESYRLG
jgi:hypothetical protein